MKKETFYELITKMESNIMRGKVQNGYFVGKILKFQQIRPLLPSYEKEAFVNAQKRNSSWKRESTRKQGSGRN